MGARVSIARRGSASCWVELGLVRQADCGTTLGVRRLQLPTDVCDPFGCSTHEQAPRFVVARNLK